MKITVDTNVLVRGVVQDDKKQARAAEKILKEAEVIAVTLPTLCEFVWVLRKVYDLAPGDIADAMHALLDTRNLVVNRPAAEAGLGVLSAGGDFTDGVIAHEGAWLGGETFVSFDKQAVAVLNERGSRHCCWQRRESTGTGARERRRRSQNEYPNSRLNRSRNSSNVKR